MTPPIPTEKADMNAKHTPGPWGIDPEFPNDIQAANGQEICITLNAHAVGEVLRIRGECPPKMACAANTALIAAAPDLREALEKLMARLDEHFGGPNRSGDWEEQAAARAALAKANGA
jgi:hypothetical protein